MTARPVNDIETDDAERVAMHPERGVRQLGIDAFHDADNLTDEHVLHHARDMLSGCRPVPHVARADLDVVTRALLAHRGADPDATEALISASRGLGLVDAEGERWALFGVDVDEDADIHNVREAQVYGDAFTWIANRAGWTIEVGGLPETIRIAAIGRDLRDIVSHPALDALPLVVTGSEESVFGIGFKGQPDD